MEDKLMIRGMIFGSFSKCLYARQKFDSDPGRRFALILEDDDDALKWFKPSKGNFRIDYRHEGQDASYDPDFVVETTKTKYLCEPKRASEMDDGQVLAKANAAAVWRAHATDHATAHGDKPWVYLLIPHNVIAANMTLAGLAAAHAFGAAKCSLREHFWVMGRSRSFRGVTTSQDIQEQLHDRR